MLILPQTEFLDRTPGWILPDKLEFSPSHLAV